MDNKSIYTEDELEILNLTKSIRVDTLKDLVKDGVPTKRKLKELGLKRAAEEIGT